MKQLPKYAVLPLAVPFFLTACVSQSKYDEALAQNAQLQQQVASLSAQAGAAQAQVGRLQNAIKYTVDSDLLFPSGAWEMSAAGKEVIGKFTSKLAPTQQNRLVVNGYTDNAPVGRALQRKGITSNQVLSQKRAENVMEYLISQGVAANRIMTISYGEERPICRQETEECFAMNRRAAFTMNQ